MKGSDLWRKGQDHHVSKPQSFVMGSHTRFNVLLLLLFLPQAKQIFGKLICVFVTSCGKCGTVSEGEKVVHGVKTQEPK